MAEWSTAQVNNFPDSSFAYVEPGEKDGEGKTTPRSLRHLPYKDGSGKVDPAHVRNAISRAAQVKLKDGSTISEGTASAIQGRLRKLLGGDSKSEQELLNIDQVELSLTRTPAVKEAFVVTKTAVKKKDEAALREEFEKLDEEALFALYQKAQEPPDEEDEEEDEDKGKKKKGKVPPQFNFDKADDATKAALRTIGEALVGITDLPPPVAEFAKSIKEKLPQNGNAEKSAEELIAFAKTSMPGLVEAVQAPIQKQLEETTKSVEELQTERDLAAMRAVAAELPGDVEVVAKRLISFKKTMTPEDFEAYIQEQKALKAQVEKSEVFKRQSSTHPAPATAEAQINQKASELIAKSDNGVTNLEEAYGVISKSDPDLWRRYQDEVRTRPKQA